MFNFSTSNIIIEPNLPGWWNNKDSKIKESDSFTWEKNSKIKESDSFTWESGSDCSSNDSKSNSSNNIQKRGSLDIEYLNKIRNKGSNVNMNKRTSLDSVKIHPTSELLGMALFIRKHS